MTAQKRTKLPLPAVLLFFAIVLGGTFFYYYTKERVEAENIPAGATVTGVISTVTDATPPQPISPVQATVPDAPAQAAAADDSAESLALPKISDTETHDIQAQAQPEAALPPADQEETAPQPTADDTILNNDAVSAETAFPEESSDSGAVPYGNGSQIISEGHVVRGEIPASQEQAGVPIAPAEQDSIVSAALIRDLAAFLAANYWPAGTHPMAHDRGISTAGVQWLNYRYGGQLHGFAVLRDNPGIERERILRYVFMPSMLRALYGLYTERFLTALRIEAAAQRRGPNQSPLTQAQMAEMFAIYSGMARNLAGAVRAYAAAPQIRPLVAAYAQASTEAANAFVEYTKSRESGDDIAVSQTSQAYRDALRQREQAKETLAAAMRRGGAGQGIDADSLVYTAQWLYRRGENTIATLAALAEILDDCALRLSTLEVARR